MRQRNWNKLYATYEKTYAKKLSKSKVGMTGKYDFYKFKVIYSALENDRKAEIRKGQRKVANITQDLVARQEQYEFTQKEAKTIKKALKEQYGMTFKLFDVRVGNLQEIDAFWDVVRQYREELLNQHMNKEEVRKKVGQVFFGSE